MASLRQYFETDFSNTLRVHVSIRTEPDALEAVLHYDLLAHTAFLSCWVPGSNLDYERVAALVVSIKHGHSQLQLAGRVTLPEIRLFPGDLEVQNNADFHVRYRLYGDPEWRSTKDISATARVFFYCESDLEPDEILRLQAEAANSQILLQVRSGDYRRARTLREQPLAFLCHDSRDKDAVARPIALGLQRMLCPVWYDEFSLAVGANLRTAIEAGIKDCHRCILVLSPAFFSNSGWTKKEFDSIFSREVLEGQNLVLPVWHNVSKKQVYEYSPSLVNVVGLKVGDLGTDEVVRRLYRAIMDNNDKSAG